MNKKTNSGLKIICLNRKASFNYFFEDLLEAGIVLKGSEIKSIRDGKVNIADAYAVEKKGEIVLINTHISPYKQASYSNHNPTDERKLLLNKREINKLIGKMQRDGFTIVPTKMYFKKGKAKIELAVAKGKKQYDKRATKKNSPRICDIDIIDFHGMKLNIKSKLNLPHKRMHKRNFVLLPLFEIEKNWKHPSKKLDIKTLISLLPVDDITSIKQI